MAERLRYVLPTEPWKQTGEGASAARAVHPRAVHVANAKSLIVRPAIITHGGLSGEKPERGIYPNTIRLSIGPEGGGDIPTDLKQPWDSEHLRNACAHGGTWLGARNPGTPTHLQEHAFSQQRRFALKSAWNARGYW